MRAVTLLILSLLLNVREGTSQTGVGIPQLQNCDNLVQTFLNNYNIPGASLAISKSGKLIYMKGFGYSDLAQTDSVYPHNLFRVASVSKPITAVAIMKLVENGQLNLNDTVFGTNGILANHIYLSMANITDNRIYNITVRQLLEHSGGWDRNIPCISGNATPYAYQPSHCDPISFPRHVTNSLGAPDPVTEEMHIRFLLEKGLDHDPGTSYHYSNIGYLVLGEIIEEVSGFSYEDYVKTNILEPLDICDIHIGKSLLTHKKEREVEYEGNGFTTLSAYGGSQQVPWEYGGWVLEAMSAHGGWIATARDLVQLVLAVDGFASKPDILNSSSIASMTTGSTVNSNYALGWSVNSFNNWWHTGSLDGSASIIVRSSGGYTWALLLNKRAINSSSFWSDLDNLPWNCISGLGATGVTDYLAVPSQGTSLIQHNTGTAQGAYTKVTLNWTNGNGDSRILVAREISSPRSAPVDGVSYVSDSTFGMGSDLGHGNYVVCDGCSNQTSILLPQGYYVVESYEYNKNVITGTQEIYNLCSRSSTDTIDAGGTVFNLIEQSLIKQYSPNPVQSHLNIELSKMFTGKTQIYDLHGTLLKSITINQQNHIALNVQNLATGVYILKLTTDSGTSSIRFVKR